MVVFACNACGQSVKKNQVEKHCSACRNCQSLSCMDCGKDFWGEEYAKHTKCLTEEEKYSGKDFKEKPGTRKGEKKQEQWIQHVHHVISTTKPDKKIKDLLGLLLKQENIPRKFNKFKNFLMNGLRVKDNKLIDETWKIFSSAHTSADLPNNSTNDSKEENVEPQPVEEDETELELPSKGKKTRKDRNGERSNDQENNTENVASKKVKVSSEEVNEVNIENNKNVENSINNEIPGNKHSHKKLKNKHRTSDEMDLYRNVDKEINNNDEDVDSGVVENSQKKKKRKRKHQDSINGEEENGDENLSTANGDETLEELKTKVTSTDGMKEADVETSHKKKKRNKSKTQEKTDAVESSRDLEQEETPTTLNESSNLTDEIKEADVENKKKKRKNKKLEDTEVSVMILEKSTEMTEDPTIEIFNVTDTVEKANVETSHKKRKHKSKHQLNTDNQMENDESINEVKDETPGDPKTKFHWTKTIKEILLESDQHKLRLKKLQKKVLQLYKALNGETNDEDELKKKFTKKCSSFKIEDGFVTLVDES